MTSAAVTSGPLSLAYVVNRHVRITAEASENGLRWRVEAPIRGQGLRISTVHASEMPGVHRIFETLSDDGQREVAIDEATVAALVNLGVLVPPEVVAEEPRFSVRLDEPVDVRVPAVDRLRPNPSLRFVDIEEHPALEPGQTVEVFDPMRGIELAYWVDRERATIIAALVAGQIAVRSLSAAAISPLYAAGVLQDSDCAPTRGLAMDPPAAAARNLIDSHGYAILEAVVPPLYVRALQQYFREYLAEGFVPLGDKQSSLRFAAHNDKLSAWLQARLLPAVSRVLPVPVKASYTYLVSYLEGADLPRHTDREQCEYTLSLAVDASPDTSRAGAWPLYLEVGNVDPATPLLLAPGDAALFAGRRLAHFRHPLPSGRRSTSLLMHFVAESFAGCRD